MFNTPTNIYYYLSLARCQLMNDFVLVRWIVL
jgi:hypothetical protein